MKVKLASAVALTALNALAALVLAVASLLAYFKDYSSGLATLPMLMVAGVLAATASYGAARSSAARYRLALVGNAVVLVMCLGGVAALPAFGFILVLPGLLATLNVALLLWLPPFILSDEAATRHT